MKCGLLGRTLGHSYSPQIHAQLGGYSYELFEKEPEELENFLRNGDFSGLNVTVPYKKAVIPYLDDLSPIARWLGAVNTIVRRPDGTLMGHNTDYFGFRSMLCRSGLDPAGKKVLVLGSGGASNTAVAVLEEAGAQVVVISRSGENNYGNLHLHRDAAIVVNTTPVGMYPKVGVSPLPLEDFRNLEGILDVVYNPARTQLLLDAEARNLPVQNGLWMLVAQAKESAEWFTGHAIEDAVIATIHRRLKAQMENIILIGMPGSGKSTVGRLLAQRLGRELADSDAYVVQSAGMSIPQILERSGEAGFRAMETEALAALSSRSGLILATGGGCVTKAENYPLLHQNGTIFLLERELSALPTNGRPLSQKGDLAQMYATRQPMYRRFADHIIDNNGKAEDAVAQILNILEEF